MTQEEKQLLLIDLCARLPYKVKGIYARTDIKNLSICEITTHLYGEMEESFNGKEKYEFIPYLRPMSSMTDEEYDEYNELPHFRNSDLGLGVERVDWLLKHHFDYHGLIEKGLAIAVTKENNPYKEKED